VTGGVLSRFKHLWPSTWPLWAFIIFESLAAVRLLPEGYARVAVAAPIVLMVPGSLVLGALFARQRRPQGTEFLCFAILLSVILSGFASLVLYVCGVLITTDSTYLCLLIASALLTIAAEVRFLHEQQGAGRRVARKPEPVDPAISTTDVGDAEIPVAVKGAGYYAVVAAVAGASLLVGGMYSYDHLPRPAPTGYTSMAWTGSPIKGDIAIGSVGKELRFEIAHHQPDTTSFQLSATWLGNPSQPLAKPLNFSIGPNRTFRGALLIPPLPDGCTYRIVVALTATGQIDPLTKRPQTWSINVDVHDPSKQQKRCS
jgi:Protein of unknown function (DUF1616)